jgi:hypothetical protein
MRNAEGLALNVGRRVRIEPLAKHCALRPASLGPKVLSNLSATLSMFGAALRPYTVMNE